MIPYNKLGLIGICGACSCIGIVFIYLRTLSIKISESSLHQEAMKLLREHAGAQHFLGQPIKEIKTNIECSPEYTDNKLAKLNFKTQVYGPKSGGILFTTGVPKKGEKMQVYEILLQVGKDTSKKLIIKKAPDETAVN